MIAPSQNIRLDIDALSGILGSISIACWLVVFTPQILENFRRSSADGLSLAFIIVWLSGDVFNVLGAILQGVLPTMTILAVYYAFADTVLLAQCLWYRGWLGGGEKSEGAGSTVTGEGVEPMARGEEEPLLGGAQADEPRRASARAADGLHAAPTPPLLSSRSGAVPAPPRLRPTSTLQTIIFNLSALVVVCAAGVFGWWISSTGTQAPRSPPHRHLQPRNQSNTDTGTGPLGNDATSPLRLDLWGQIFGYLCAALYLGSRVPQLLLNFRRKSTEGVSMLFFLFACVGNLTFVLSILAFEPDCAREAAAMAGRRRGGFCRRGEWRREYARYVVVNASWLLGSAGTLGLDAGIFSQFWWYRGRGAGVVQRV